MVDFIKSYNDESDEGYFLFDAQYPENLDNFHNGLPFFAWRNENWKSRKAWANLHDKSEYDIHIRNLKKH